MKTLTKPCLNCGKVIIKQSSCSLKNWINQKKYCSRTCAAKGNAKNPQWIQRQSEAHKGKKLSAETRRKQSEAQSGEKHSQWKGGLPKCLVCGKQLAAYRAKHCKRHRPITIETRYKRSVATKGEKSHLWRGGITPINRGIRTSLEMKLWRKAVYQRDNWACQLCGAKGVELNADHIKPFAHYPEYRFDVSNGRTLCVPCHKKTETYGNKIISRKLINNM